MADENKTCILQERKCGKPTCDHVVFQTTVPRNIVESMGWRKGNKINFSVRSSIKGDFVIMSRTK